MPVQQQLQCRIVLVALQRSNLPLIPLQAFVHPYSVSEPSKDAREPILVREVVSTAESKAIL